MSEDANMTVIGLYLQTILKIVLNMRNLNTNLLATVQRIITNFYTMHTGMVNKNHVDQHM